MLRGCYAVATRLLRSCYAVATRLLQEGLDNPNRFRYIDISVGVGAGRTTKDKNMNQRVTKVNASCPTCKTPLPVIVGKENTVRVSICGHCHDEWRYSAWVIAARHGMTYTKIELEGVRS